MKKVSKLLISVLASIILLLSFSTIALAAPDTGGGTSDTTSAAPGPWYNQSYPQWYGKVYGGDQNEIFGERYTAAQVRWVLYGLLAFFTNPTGDATIGDCTSAASTGDATACSTKLVPLINNINLQFKIGDSGKNQSLVGMIFEDRTLSGITYVKDLGRKFNIIPVANAQSAGFGYTGALGIIPNISDAWTVIRNLSYAIFVVIIIVFAFMIMFRIKISPQVVVSVQSALPKIAITLILVTFSYAIAGFMIDIMYIAIGIISLIFSNFKVFGIGFSGLGGIGATNAVTGYFTLLTQGPTFLGMKTGVLGLMVMYIVNYFLAYLIIVFGGFAAGFGAISNVGGGAGGIGGSIISILTFIIGAIGLLVVFVLAIVNFFRIILLLARAFLSIILLTIFAPLQLTIGTVVPGMGFGSWLKSLAAKLAVFPAVGVMFILALWLLQLGSGVIAGAVKAGTGASFQEGWPPLLGGSPQMVALGFLVASIALFIMIPSVSKMIESFMAGKGFNLESAIGEGFAPASTFGLGALQTASSVQQQEYARAEDALQRGTIQTIDPQLQTRKTIMDAARAIGRGRIK